MENKEKIESIKDAVIEYLDLLVNRHIEPVEDKIENLISDLNDEIKCAEQTIAEYKSDSYTVSAIEMEGFLRGLNYSLELIKSHKP